jgi:diguanylate cyclase (GGDEF)-like protein/hemerythrin-like metal-binding protein
MTFYDQLTGLPDKAGFVGLLQQSLAVAQQMNRKLGLLLLDLDGYGAINDNYGREAGDVLLNTIAERLKSSLRGTDVLAYFGEDSFAVLLTDPKDTAAVIIAAERIRKNLGAPLFLAEGVEGSVGASVGVAVYPENGTGADRLLTVADSAMFESKTSGKNTTTLFKGLTHEREDITPWLMLGEEHQLDIPEIDAQHEKLASLINGLYEVLKSASKSNWQRADAIYDELVETAGLNFDTEAHLMSEADYPHADAHNRAHKFLLDELRYLKKRIIEVNELQAFHLLRDWLVAHIEKDDKPLGDFLLARKRLG